MIFLFTKTKQFSTRLIIKRNGIETLLTIFTESFKWNKNTKFSIEKAYERMEILWKFLNFTKSKEDKLEIYNTYIRGVLEQSCLEWQ